MLQNIVLLTIITIFSNHYKLGVFLEGPMLDKKRKKMSITNKDEFFREVTIRICSSLDIRSALANVFEYMREHFPLDILSLNILDSDLCAVRRIANAMTKGLDIPEEIVPLSKKVWNQVQEFSQHNRNAFISSDSIISKELFNSIASHFKMEGNSDLILPLWIDEELIGTLSLRIGGERGYNLDHVELLGTVAEPFAIALANALAHEKILKYRDVLIDDNRFLSKELSSNAGDEIVGSSSGLRNVMEMVRQVAPLNNSVLLLGETGTGKEVLAKFIHQQGPRSSKPFIAINCAAIQSTVLESELFGYEAGAFTGAEKRKNGLMEVADEGILFWMKYHPCRWIFRQSSCEPLKSKPFAGWVEHVL